MNNNYHSFNTRQEEKDWVNKNGVTDPYISYIKSTSELFYGYQKYTPISLGSFLHRTGDVDNNPSSDIVGICVIPEGLLPDGKARFMSMVNMSASSNTGTTSNEYLKWSTNERSIILPNQYDEVPTDNDLSGVISGKLDYGYIPTDITDNTININNPFDLGTNYSKYAGPDAGDSIIPGPYNLEGGLNILYTSTQTSSGTSINTPLCHFDGKENTELLVNSSTSTPAADACANFAPGYRNGSWYLPSMGELGFVMPRIQFLNSRISDAVSLGSAFGVSLSLGGFFWSSSESSSGNAWYLNTYYGGYVYGSIKSNGYLVRSFLAI